MSEEPKKNTGAGFDAKLSREEIEELPIEAYQGLIHVVRDQEGFEKVMPELCQEEMLGFDTETRPAFRKGESYSPSLLQLAGRNAVYLFQLRLINFPKVLRQILANPEIIKAGVAIGQDIRKLKELGSFKEAGFVDLGELARNAGMKNHGLRGMAAVLMNVRISKGAQRSNWAKDNLTSSQVRYAATDAWISRELYLRMQKKGMMTLPLPIRTSDTRRQSHPVPMAEVQCSGPDQ